MIPPVSNEAESEIALEGRGANIILDKVGFCFDVSMQANCFKGAIGACFEDFTLGFNLEVIDFIPPRNEICGPLVAKLSANFLVSA